MAFMTAAMATSALSVSTFTSYTIYKSQMVIELIKQTLAKKINTLTFSLSELAPNEAPKLCKWLTNFKPVCSWLPANAAVARKWAAPLALFASEPLPPLIANFNVTV